MEVWGKQAAAQPPHVITAMPMCLLAAMSAANIGILMVPPVLCTIAVHNKNQEEVSYVSENRAVVK